MIDAILKTRLEDRLKAYKKSVAIALREVEEAKIAAQCRMARDEEASKSGDPEATLRRIMRAMDVQTWPNNMDLAESVETMMKQYQNQMIENSELRKRLEAIESCA